MQFFVAELPDGRLNVREVFMTGGDDPERVRPAIRGTIEEEPAFYNVMPITSHVNGDVMKGVPAEQPLDHLLLTKVLTREPYELDFRSIYCFDCARQEFYRAEPFDAWENIQEPVLRFKPRERVFIIDDADKIPPSHYIVEEHDARELGLEVSIDPELDTAIAAIMQWELELREEASGSGDAGLREEEQEEEDTIFDDSDMMREGDDPDVPAVDLA